MSLLWLLLSLLAPRDISGNLVPWQLFEANRVPDFLKSLGPRGRVVVVGGGGVGVAGVVAVAFEQP